MDKRLDRSFGLFIRSLRKARGMNLKALAKASGLAPSYLRQLEADAVPLPSPDICLRLAHALGESPERLLFLALPDHPKHKGEA
jgi:transcriptional regulator with XRE-family HTH domain